MRELSQEQLLLALDRAIDLYQACQPIVGMLPSSPVLLGLLQACGVNADLERIRLCREIVIAGKYPVRSGE